MSNELMFSDALLRPAPARAARSADADLAHAAIERLDAAARGDRAALERLRPDLTAAARAVSEAKTAWQALAIKPEAAPGGKGAEKGAELAALLDELEHRIDAMIERAGAERPARPAHELAPESEPESEPASAREPEDASDAGPEPETPAEPESPPETAAVTESAPEPETNISPLPPISIGRVPTVSAVVSQLGRGLETDAISRPAFLDTPMPASAADRDIPTVSMLEALVEALTAPAKSEAGDDAAEAEAPQSVLPSLDMRMPASDGARDDEAAEFQGVVQTPADLREELQEETLQEEHLQEAHRYEERDDEREGGQESERERPHAEAWNDSRPDGVDPLPQSSEGDSASLVASLVESDAEPTPNLIEERAREILQCLAIEADPAVAGPETADASGLENAGASAAEFAAPFASEAVREYAPTDRQHAQEQHAQEQHTQEQHTEDEPPMAAFGSEAAPGASDPAAPERGEAEAAFAAQPEEWAIAREAPLPDAALLTSYARTEEFSYMPPDDVGTAVIFAARSALEAPAGHGDGLDPGRTPSAEMEFAEPGGAEGAASQFASGGVEFAEAGPLPADLEALAAEIGLTGETPTEFVTDDSVPYAAGAEAERDLPPIASDAETGGAETEIAAANWPLAQDAADSAAEAYAEPDDDAPSGLAAPTGALASGAAAQADDARRRFPRLPQPTARDPLAPFAAMSDEEKIALFS